VNRVRRPSKFFIGHMTHMAKLTIRSTKTFVFLAGVALVISAGLPPAVLTHKKARLTCHLM
jgi:hypothetical protein